ncbi:carboxypeptidase-like regulatory domain-containing protein [Flavivirga jejuensis]|uniref:Carboxypeptidase-like regulatory domain-containing protein n=1 Tax=Flavivirga jejuensis TaxID=870487 RepID=A0ABT8WUG9_9FLAO|nr:carboxypeptidase-like regulatory domain-containing protein [Flavivirga jejuensis]MDO5976815.1 carboxypeptidase-like regulatory domain-containing protein [Flavivirga jejuensis]
MKLVLTPFIFIFLSLYASGQSIDRIEINGIILSTDNDVEAVTIFNTSSNKGTITNEKGVFVIKAALRDIIEISALQFQTVSITIDADVIKTQQLKIHLVQQVNRLDAVVLSSGLSGNILTDVANVKTIKPIYIDMGNMDVDFEYNDVKAFDNEVVVNHLKAIINPEARNFMPDIVKIFKLLTKKDLPLKVNLLKEKVKERPEQKDLLDVYDHKAISTIFNLPLEHVGDFVAFVEEKGINSELFKRENEMYLIEFLIKQNELFLKLQNVEN